MTRTCAPRPARFADGRLLVFAKAPVPGEVKTRLMPAVDAGSCAQLQRWLIQHTLETAVQSTLCPIELWCAPDCADPFFAECARTFGIETRTQRGADLGVRMHHALQDALGHADFALLIGCDSPGLDTAYLAQACATLAAGVPIVLGPAEDGGYTLIGAQRTAAQLFEDIAWGSGAVLAQTRARLRGLAWQWRELERRWDIDLPADLPRLAAEFSDAPIRSAIRANRLAAADSTAQP